MSSASNPASNLPPLSSDAAAHGERVVAHLREAIAAAGGWIDFARYMDLALYAPGLGYYSAGARKLGRDGDFVTAPELTPLFGHTLARQIGECVAGGLADVLEIGAGSGALAATVLEALERADRLPATYQILELSADLRERSRDAIAARVPHLLERVMWLNRMPPSFEGVVLGNEVLDAMPVHVVHRGEAGIEERGVVWDRVAERFAWSNRPAVPELCERVEALGLPPPYTTEIALAAEGFVASIGAVLRRGVVLFIDYGFPAHEYYHVERATGTLMCHYRHRAHADPFFVPGLQDITAHVDFTAIARAATGAGLTLAGYTSQASFLLNAGLTELLAAIPADDKMRYLPLANAAQRLVSPAEMGELFKAIAFTRGWPTPLVGFTHNNRGQVLISTSS
jgi:SAM-dependent MidA family methyltransferase